MTSSIPPCKKPLNFYNSRRFLFNSHHLVGNLFFPCANPMVPTDWLVVKNILIRQLKLKFRTFSQRNQRASFTGWRRLCVTTVSRIVIEEANPVAVAVSELSWFEHIVFCAIQKGRNASCKNRLWLVLKCFTAFFLR